MATPQARRITSALSPQHRRILELMCQGKRAHEIGAALGLKEQTVANIKVRLYRALGVSNGAAAVALGVRAGLGSGA